MEKIKNKQYYIQSKCSQIILQVLYLFVNKILVKKYQIIIFDNEIIDFDNA